MAFSLDDGDDQSMTEMNLIPLIDIMLVLMIIFLVTATVANPSIPLTLPKTSAQVQPTQPKELQVSIKANGQIYLEQKAVSLAQLEQQFKQLQQQGAKPSVVLRADKDSKYDSVAQVMATASGAGLADISFESKN